MLPTGVYLDRVTPYNDHPLDECPFCEGDAANWAILGIPDPTFGGYVTACKDHAEREAEIVLSDLGFIA